MFKPFQIITAEHWFAVYEKSGHDAISIPLVCWALGEFEDDTGKKENAIHGMIIDEDGMISPAPAVKDFVYYEMESQEIDIVTDILN